MLKNILRLLSTSVSLVALLLVANLANASTTSTNFDYQFQSPALNLNIVSPSLQSTSNKDALLNHFGCSCNLCTQTLEQSMVISHES